MAEKGRHPQKSRHQWLQTFVSDKRALSVLMILLAFFSMTSLLDGFLQYNLLGMLERRGGDYLDKTLIRATTSFALARGLNGTISIIQGTDFSVSLGVGGNLAIGEALDPINDLVERFSVIMLASTVSLGIQKVLMGIGAGLGFRVFLSLALLLIVLGLWNSHAGISKILQRLGYKLLIFAIVLRVAIPVAATVGSLISELFLQEKYQEATKVIDQFRKTLQEEYAATNQEQSVPKDNAGEGDTTEEKWYDFSQYNPKRIFTDIKEKISVLTEQITNITKYIVDLIVVFLMETIVVPLLTLWGLVKFLGLLVGNR